VEAFLPPILWGWLIFGHVFRFSACFSTTVSEARFGVPGIRPSEPGQVYDFLPLFWKMCLIFCHPVQKLARS
jgi:hypothetical protein